MNLFEFAIPMNCEVPEDAYGVWQIPSLNVIIPVYKEDLYKAQKVVDAENSACLHTLGRGYAITDHCGSSSNNGKGVWEIQNVKVDDAAFMVTNKDTKQYRCYAVMRVDVKPWGTLSINEKQVSAYSSSDIVCRSCVGSNKEQNYIAMFKYIGTIQNTVSI